MIIADSADRLFSKETELSVESTVSPAGSGVWANNGEMMPKKQALIIIAAKKNPEQGLDNFSFSPPKSKLTETILIR